MWKLWQTYQNLLCQPPPWCSTRMSRLFWKMSLLCLPKKIVWKSADFPNQLQHCSVWTKDQWISSPLDDSCDDYSWTLDSDITVLLSMVTKLFMLLVFPTRRSFLHHYWRNVLTFQIRTFSKEHLVAKTSWFECYELTGMMDTLSCFIGKLVSFYCKKYNLTTKV